MDLSVAGARDALAVTGVCRIFERCNRLLKVIVETAKRGEQNSSGNFRRAILSRIYELVIRYIGSLAGTNKRDCVPFSESEILFFR